jgi:hypothetical protein
MLTGEIWTTGTMSPIDPNSDIPLLNLRTRYRAKTPSLVSLRAERDRGAGAIGPQAEAAAKPAALAADRELSAVEAFG